MYGSFFWNNMALKHFLNVLNLKQWIKRIFKENYNQLHKKETQVNKKSNVLIYNIGFMHIFILQF